MEITLSDYNELFETYCKYQTILNYMMGKDAKYSTVSIDKDFLKAVDPYAYKDLEASWNEEKA